MTTIVGASELEKIAVDIHIVSSKVAQEIFTSRRNLILCEMAKLTGQDYTNIIPTLRKGRPVKDSKSK